MDLATNHPQLRKGGMFLCNSDTWFRGWGFGVKVKVYCFGLRNEFKVPNFGDGVASLGYSVAWRTASRDRVTK